MPSVAENVAKWRDHKWDRDGHEWSPGGTWRGTEMLWYRSIFPRIHAHLPSGTLLEIAPGHGRWTTYLIPLCRRLIGVDISDGCVDTCARRFAASNAAFVLNDGRSLPVDSSSIDFAFSFDSLVHVEAPEVCAYLRELKRALKPGAFAWLHHSNLGAYAVNGAVPHRLTRRLWRAQTVSARVFRNGCRDAGLRCVAQEVVNWVGRGARSDRHRIGGDGIPLTECFSLVQRPGNAADSPTRVFVNRRFVDEWRQQLVLAELYIPEPEGTGSPLLKRGATYIPWTARVRDGIRRRADEWQSRTQDQLAAFSFRHREPIVRSVKRGVCPDCGGRLNRGAAGAVCAPCRVVWTVN